MKAELLPLNGKYYGTKIKLECGGNLNVWLTFEGEVGGKGYVPSDRLLEEANITREQWDNNEPVRFLDCFGEWDTDYAREVVCAVDHFEDQLSYEIAKHIVESLENYK